MFVFTFYIINYKKLTASFFNKSSVIIEHNC